MNSTINMSDPPSSDLFSLQRKYVVQGGIAEKCARMSTHDNAGMSDWVCQCADTGIKDPN